MVGYHLVQYTTIHPAIMDTNLGYLKVCFHQLHPRVSPHFHGARGQDTVAFFPQHDVPRAVS